MVIYHTMIYRLCEAVVKTNYIKMTCSILQRKQVRHIWNLLCPSYQTNVIMLQYEVFLLTNLDM